MRRWFLSYNSQDFELAHRLVAEVARRDAKAEIFFAPQSMRPGTYWMPTLAKEIAEATAFVLLIGKNGLGPWQTLEYQEAMDRSRKECDFAVIPMLFDSVPAPGLPFLRQLHWIISADPACESSVGRLMDAAAGGGSPAGELWRHTAPYRGLSAMTEADTDFFFGRGRETAEVIGALATAPDRLALLLGNSGVGKSSLAQAGVLAALLRQDWPETAEPAVPWPPAFHSSRPWCFLRLKPGVEPVRALVEPFLSTWQFEAVDPKRAELLSSWVDCLREGRIGLRDLLDATQARYRDELHQPGPPAFLLYIDQGEELYVRAEERERRCFSEILARALPDPRLRVMMSMRADFFGELQKDEALFRAHRQINVPPLREAQLRDVVSRPAELLSARFETPRLVDIITRCTVEDSVKDVGALPLLSYTLDDMWKQMVQNGDGVLRLSAPSFELGGVLVLRADTFLATHPASEEALRRVLTLKLADVREDGEPIRRCALRSEFSETEWRLVCELADDPNRLLVTVTSETGETYAEVAHEAIFRRWGKLREWIAAEREFLAWRSGLEAARRAWQATPDASKRDALLMGLALDQAQAWLAKRAEDLPSLDREFIALSIARDRKVRGRARRVEALIYVLLVGIVGGIIGWSNQSYVKEQWHRLAVERPFAAANILPYALGPAAEQALKPRDFFRECSADQEKDYCPQMVVLPAGSFIMGSAASGPRYQPSEQPQHEVTITQPFAVSKFELTFAEWDACADNGDCPQGISDSGWGRGRQPVINVTWDDAQRYVAWLSRVTGRPYRLLTEAEYEYAARAESTTAYPWGDDIGQNNANCKDCGSRWDNTQTAPVGSFAANGFGLFDMVGNVWEWVEDCVMSEDYTGAPRDGSAWVESNACKSKMVRGGSWNNTPDNLRSANRVGTSRGFRDNMLGFRIGRTLIVP